MQPILHVIVNAINAHVIAVGFVHAPHFQNVWANVAVLVFMTVVIVAALIRGAAKFPQAKGKIAFVVLNIILVVIAFVVVTSGAKR